LQLSDRSKKAVDTGIRRCDDIAGQFAAAMARLGPYGPKPHLAVAVSGGADSTALALLVDGWVRKAGGRLTALVVDHGLRTESCAEAALTAARLAPRGIDSRVLKLSGLEGGAKLQERARAARHAALAQAARAAGALFLLLGHHHSDQAETVAMRAARGDSGLEGMAGWAARHDILLLRPLLDIAPERLRAFLKAENMEWVEDPSNADQKYERVRLRLGGAKAQPADSSLRQSVERDAADFLARCVVLRPEGFAVLHADTAPSAALAALLRVIGGANYPPDRAAIAGLAAALRPATLGGVRIAAAGKLGPGWLLAREFCACAPPVAAVPGAVWDNRFRLAEGVKGASFGALGEAARDFRRQSDLPALVLQTLPCLRLHGKTWAAPARFTPPAPVTCHPFVA
jgi:tRNA(Ile)-lysidine synthase